MKLSKRNIANWNAKRDKLIAGPPIVSKYAAKNGRDTARLEKANG